MEGEQPAKNYTFEEILQEKGYILYTNVGCSMMPLLRENKDIIEIRSINKPLQKYDVILYKRGVSYILHRIISICPNGRYVIAGDHNTFKEFDVTDDMILGIMTRVIRDGKIITPDNFKYKLYSHLWVDFYPVRVFLIKSKAFVIRLFSAIKHKKLTIANVKKYLSERH